MLSNIRPIRHFTVWLTALAALAVVAVSPPVRADAAATPFTQARFEALQAQGALVLVDVAADWCPTCRAQKAVIQSFQAEHPEVELHVLTVDFDTQKEWVKHFKAPRQSTLLVYKGTEQQWFAVAETRQEVIFAALLEAAGA